MNQIINKNSVLWKYQNPVIIYYHMISEKVHPYYPHGAISPNEFKEQIKNLKRVFNIISLPEAIERANSNNSIKNSLVLTIDDGFKECFSIIAPILNDEKVAATFFLINNCIDNSKMMWQHQLEYLQQTLSAEKLFAATKYFLNQIDDSSNPASSLPELSKKWEMKDKDKFTKLLWDIAFEQSNSEWLQQHQPYMSTQQIQELISAGFTIGSHSTTHPYCDQINFDELQNEIVGSCNSIGDKLGIEIKHFSYPFGRRAKKKNENRIIETSNIQCLIGGKPRLFRKNTFPLWEAYNFERDKSKLLYHLLVNSFLFK